MWDEEKFIQLEKDNEILMKYIKKRSSDGKVDLEPIIPIVRGIVQGSASIKAEVVTLDEREGGLRNLLNFGHTIGHAYEAILTPYILHGECVSIGMVLEAEIARYLGHLSDGAVARLAKCLKAYNLPITPNDPIVRSRSKNISTPVPKLLDIMNVDKKNDGNVKKIVMLTRIGKTLEKQATKVSDSIIQTILSEDFLITGNIKSAPNTVEVTPPGSKSISNRALILASLGKGVCKIKNLLHSDDTQHMLTACQLLGGTTVSFEDHGEVLVVEGNGGHFLAPASEIYLGNAGTASRFLTTLATLVSPSGDANHVVLTGNARMKQRPIGPLVDSLNKNGCKIEYLESVGSLPLKIQSGTGFKGGRIELEATVSSQYVSSILMAAPYASSPVTLALVGGKPISQLYIDMTISMMKTFGIEVEKSTTEANVYHIPQGTYTNPKEYVIESDASSATYPLAFAALSGTTCTVPNIGSSSLQGDARFATDVLKPMGCTVTQTATSTTVTGPPVNTLKPIPSIDMEPMTDAFLTASVLAAVANNNAESKTTNIYGIANQRVKECNRIDAMIHELAKFGVVTREHADGLEIDGIDISKLKVPKNGVHTYDDHRVAMSLSLLASALEEEVLIKDRRCVEKTWPGWWDVLSRKFNISLRGFNNETEFSDSASSCGFKSPNEDKTIVLIGMRGAGKTSLGQWVADSLGLKFVDMDQFLESNLGKSIPQVIEEQGWAGFRSEELKTLKEFLSTHPRGYVAACGGGIVETPEARDLLKKYMSEDRIVIHIHRNVDDIVSYLNIDKTRPAFTNDIINVWEHRKGWYHECSNYIYYSLNFDIQLPNGSQAARHSLDMFLRNITGSRDVSVHKQTDKRSAFVCLTLKDIRAFSGIKKCLVGSDAVELRVDLLKEQGQQGAIPRLEYVTEQVAYLRSVTDLPIIFTVRTVSQGGQFPDNAEDEVEKLIRHAYRLGIEYVDLELTWSVPLVDALVKSRGHTRIIASHHNISGDLKWEGDGSAVWEDYYERALSVGDVIKFVGMAHDLTDNLQLESFRAKHNSRKPLIAINMGDAGKLSRVLNTVLTPVTHESFPFMAAPGQLTVKEINQCLSLIGGLSKKEFFVCGSPVSKSKSPALHTACYKSLGLPHSYTTYESDDAEKVFEHIKSLGSKFGGASVTIPLKLKVIPYLSELTPQAKLVGAVNTIIPLQDGKFRGDNTDWIGIVKSLESIGARKLQNSNLLEKHSALIIGAGGTSRAAILACHELGFSTIYLINRTASKAQEVAKSFPTEYGVKFIDSTSDFSSLLSPLVVISCVPATIPLSDISEVVETVKKVITLKPENGHLPYQRCFLDVAYIPSVTPIMDFVEKVGSFRTIGGKDMLVYQGVEQFEIWTKCVAPVEEAKKAVYEQD